MMLVPLAADVYYYVRQTVARNPNTPVASILLLLYDIDVQTRRAAAQHATIPAN